MLEVAFIELVSAGLRRFFGHPLDPMTADSDGGEFVRHLLLAEPEAAGRLMNRCVTDLWHNIRAVGLPAEHTEAHLRLLPAILVADGAAPSPSRECAFTKCPSADGDRGAAFFAQAPSALADAIILAHRIETDADRIDETILTFLLETFLKSLHACRADIETLMPRLASPGPAPQASARPAGDAGPLPHLRTAAPSRAPDHPIATTRSPSSALLEKIARADALSISVPILELITVALINQTRSPDLRQADIASAATEARAIRAELASIAEGQPFAVPELDHLLAAFDSARFEACNRILTSIEDEAVKRATARTPRIAEEVERAIAMRLLRARLHSLAGAHVAAARQLGNAQRHLARSDHARRWQLAAREGRHYERAAFHDRAPASLEQAARACSSLLGGLGASEPAGLRAEVQSELAYYLIRLGEFEQSATRFEIAAQLLADALTNLDAARDPDARCRALIRQADALSDLARLTGAEHLIDQAVATCQEASTLLTSRNAGPGSHSPARRPFDESVTALRARLALALANAPSTRDDAALRDTALVTIIEVLPDLTQPRDLADDAGFCAHRLAALCHYAIALRLAAAGQPKAAGDQHATATRILSEAGLEGMAHSLEAPAATTTAPPPSAATAA